MADIPDIFNAGIAQQLNTAMGPLLFPVQVLKCSVTENATNNTINDVTFSAPHPARGFRSRKNLRNKSGTLVKMNADAIIILGASLPGPITPEPGDRIVLVNSNETFTIVDGGVSRDPAGGTFTCIVT